MNALTQFHKGPFRVRDDNKAAHISAKVTVTALLALATGADMLIVHLPSTTKEIKLIWTNKIGLLEVGYKCFGQSIGLTSSKS